MELNRHVTNFSMAFTCCIFEVAKFHLFQGASSSSGSFSASSRWWLNSESTSLVSGATSSTSLSSSQYSMGSVYQLEESQLELNTEIPLGEGNFGVDYRGIMRKSNGEWDQVSLF